MSCFDPPTGSTTTTNIITNTADLVPITPRLKWTIDRMAQSMGYRLDDEQQAVLATIVLSDTRDVHDVVEACAGSGKTTLMVGVMLALLRCRSDWFPETADDDAGNSGEAETCDAIVTAFTYTRTGAGEITSKLHKANGGRHIPHAHVQISTLHSFCSTFMSSIGKENLERFDAFEASAPPPVVVKQEVSEDTASAPTATTPWAVVGAFDESVDRVVRWIDWSLSSEPAQPMDADDRRVKYFIVDECQDTSKLLWRCLRSLYAFYRHIGVDVRFVLVGDAQQSIFGWSNADTEPFVHPETHFLTNVVWRHHVLTRNYRSHPSIVDFSRRPIGRSKQWPVDADDSHVSVRRVKSCNVTDAFDIVTAFLESVSESLEKPLKVWILARAKHELDDWTLSMFQHPRVRLSVHLLDDVVPASTTSATTSDEPPSSQEDVDDEPMDDDTKDFWDSRVGTCHKSKGGECSIVVLLNATEKNFPTHDAEGQRLLHVALSRPKHYLLVLYPEKETLVACLNDKAIAVAVSTPSKTKTNDVDAIAIKRWMSNPYSDTYDDGSPTSWSDVVALYPTCSWRLRQTPPPAKTIDAPTDRMLRDLLDTEDMTKRFVHMVRLWVALRPLLFASTPMWRARMFAILFPDVTFRLFVPETGWYKGPATFTHETREDDDAATVMKRLSDHIKSTREPRIWNASRAACEQTMRRADWTWADTLFVLGRVSNPGLFSTKRPKANVDTLLNLYRSARANILSFRHVDVLRLVVYEHSQPMGELLDCALARDAGMSAALEAYTTSLFEPFAKHWSSPDKEDVGGEQRILSAQSFMFGDVNITVPPCLVTCVSDSTIVYRHVVPLDRCGFDATSSSIVPYLAFTTSFCQRMGLVSPSVVKIEDYEGSDKKRARMSTSKTTFVWIPKHGTTDIRSCLEWSLNF